MQPTNLIPHPEGGRFQEVFRSSTKISTPDGQDRSALTHIYFSLKPGEVSRFHKVNSDEIWNLYQGAGVRLYIWDDASTDLPHSIELSVEANRFCHIIPAGLWQAAEPIADEVLVGCSVAPGFEYTDFILIEQNTTALQRLNKVAPQLGRFITV